MADNYLERRMEEHLRRQAAPGSPASRRQGLRAGEVAVRYPAVRVVVAGGCSEAGQALIRAFRSLGCRVAFTDPDARAATRLAQAEGAQYHPGADPRTVASRLVAAGDQPRAIISPADRLITFASGATVAIPDGCRQSADIAAFCCYAIHPSAAWMSDINE